MADYVDWPGKSGKTYRYWYLETISASGIKSESGNYMFVKRLANGNLLPVYIGQADDLQSRLPNHERLADAKNAGATVVMGHTPAGGELVRLDEERDLIQRWEPVLNTHHRKAL